MRNMILVAFVALGAFSCGSSQAGDDMKVSVQDPCMMKCQSLFNRCVDQSGGDASRCNEDRAACEQECIARSAEEEGGDGEIIQE